MFFGILESRCLCLSWGFSLHVLFGMRALECFRICFGLSSTWFPSVLHGDAVDAGAVGLPPACFLFQLLWDFWFLSLSPHGPVRIWKTTNLASQCASLSVGWRASQIFAWTFRAL